MASSRLTRTGMESGRPLQDYFPHILGGEPQAAGAQALRPYIILTYAGVNRMGDPVGRPYIFPTYVGVNRSGPSRIYDSEKFPHIRGGEPYSPSGFLTPGGVD
jgi:hypothetical protein